ncbi:hypothetical protein CPB83DRAFT_863228 [Crepidotus variabilis]|uniref:Uncharacterized protein n=1 Tax=Crepidotus variabilis TaxID=179855 RepID=A0A9P6E5Z6_9AGAR|nr:hypothetical protein CPB83DRAFT_863228 [Crepidotus variabilis]
MKKDVGGKKRDVKTKGKGKEKARPSSPTAKVDLCKLLDNAVLLGQLDRYPSPMEDSDAELESAVALSTIDYAPPPTNVPRSLEGNSMGEGSSTTQFHRTDTEDNNVGATMEAPAQTQRLQFLDLTSDGNMIVIEYDIDENGVIDLTGNEENKA